MGLVLIAVSGGCIVGTGTLIGRWIYNVFVEPTAWGRGIGGQIMDALERHARHANAPAVGLFSNHSAAGFYEARGFRRHCSLSIDQQEAIEMYKNLEEAARVSC